MNPLKLFASFVLLLPLLTGVGHAAEATKKLPTSIIAIVDVQRILEESQVSQNVQKQLDAQRSKFQKEIEKEENSLRKAEQDLSAQRGQLSSRIYADREQQLRQRFLSVEKHVQARRKILDQSYTDSMNVVRSALLQIIDEVAREYGANIAVVKQQALWTDQPLEITDEVLKRFDQKTPKIDISSIKEEKQK